MYPPMREGRKVLFVVGRGMGTLLVDVGAGEGVREGVGGGFDFLVDVEVFCVRFSFVVGVVLVS